MTHQQELNIIKEQLKRNERRLLQWRMRSEQWAAGFNLIRVNNHQEWELWRRDRLEAL